MLKFIYTGNNDNKLHFPHVHGDEIIRITPFLPDLNENSLTFLQFD